MGREWYHDRDDETQHNTKERWLVTYADLITLLLVFFIVMYALSSRISVENFTELSNSLAISLKKPKPRAGDKHAYSEDLSKQTKKYEATAKAVVDSLVKTDPKSDVKVDIDQRGMVVSLIDTSFFDPGSATLKSSAYRVLSKMAANFRKYPNSIRVEGHTDNIPIHTARFPTNWELSSARATAVVRFLIDQCGLPSNRLYAAGYADNMPVESNGTAEGRKRNRRVEIILERDQDKPPIGAKIPVTPAAVPAVHKAPEPVNKGPFGNGPFGGGFSNPFGKH